MTQTALVSYGPIRLGLHAAIDWLLVVAGLVGPFVLGYTDQFWPTAYSYAAVGIGIVLNAITNYPGGVAKLLPMRWHQFIEWTSPAPFIAGPWFLFPDATEMKWLLTGIGIGILINTALTQKLKIVSAPATS